MKSAAPTAATGSEFNEFLYAPIAEERSGLLLSMLSLLARSNLDPWDEAARLAQLPRATAASFLTKLISAVPDGPSARTDPGALAERLMDLLPQRLANKGSIANSASGFAASRHGLAGPLIAYVVLMMFLLVNQWLTERASREAFRNGAATSAPANAAQPQTPAPISATASAPPRS